MRPVTTAAARRKCVGGRGLRARGVCGPRCGDVSEYAKALEVVRARVQSGGMQVWREQGKELGALMEELAAADASGSAGPVAALGQQAVGAMASDVVQMAVAASKSEKFMDRIGALPALAAVVKSKVMAGEGRAACEFLDAEGVLADLFGERAHERIVLEAVPLLRASAKSADRLNLLLSSSLNAHDTALRSAANA
eukprot:3358741-Rhodomonas_salina.1